ncbi:MAG: NAD(P)/FAD-dependent oxidoreductase [Opitutaceae bacterium]
MKERVRASGFHPSPFTLHPFQVAVVGGGAAGYFAAIRCAEADPRARVHVFEKSLHPLAKVRISGGGRCNVTHACFEPRELVRRYPRGSRELIGVFHRFGPRDTIAWFEERGVQLKTEPDGRMFPVTDSSATIIGALTDAATQAGVEVRLQTPVKSIERTEGGRFILTLAAGETFEADRVLLATGGTQGAGGIEIARAFGHTIEPQAPSLFAFNIQDERLRGLEGVSVPDAGAGIAAMGLKDHGPLLITHRGLSGPAVLRLSAWGAREIQASGYRFELSVNWARPHTHASALELLTKERSVHSRRQVANSCPLPLPNRLWEMLVSAVRIQRGAVWAHASNAILAKLAAEVVDSRFAVTGKSMNKEEFVTCGGVRLREVDFKTMESRIRPGLHFAGEVLDIDGVTGGFNFQAAWSTGWLAGSAMASDPNARSR